MSSPPPPQPPNSIPSAVEVPMYDPDDPIGMVKYIRGLDIAEGRPDPLPPPISPQSAPPTSPTGTRKPEPIPPSPPPPCARVDYGELGSLDKRRGKCLVACYCCVECQREDWPAYKKQCKLNRKFEIREQTEEVMARDKLL